MQHASIDSLASVRVQPLIQLMYSYRWEPHHALQVRRLCMELFDQLQDLHHMGEKERELLEAAAILHDIGFSISSSKHHKHSARLIRTQELPGFDSDQVELIALIARYHRKAFPKMKHARFQRLGSGAQATVTRLSALLRLADGLDRNHRSAVQYLKCHRHNDTVRIEVSGGPGLEIDRAGGERKRHLFEQTFAKRVQLVVLLPRATQKAPS